MSRECTTHHHACDCREARFAGLEKEQVKLLDIIVTQEARIAELEAEIAGMIEVERDNYKRSEDALVRLEAELKRLRALLEKRE